MSRVLLVLIAVLALAGAALWFTTHTSTVRGSRPSEASPPAADAEPGAHAFAPAPATTPQAQPAPREQPPSTPEPVASQPSRREPASPRDAELARARWIDGRVLFPAGTPDDEEVFVTADGKAFEDGSDQRVKVARDGSFRVAFSEKTRTGHFELEARYLYLDEIVRWKSAEPSRTVVLEPKLGGRIAGRARPPAGTDAGEVGGKLELEVSHRAGNSFDSEQRGTHELSKGLDFRFDALPPGVDPERSYEVSYDGEAFIGRRGKLLPEAGKTLALELQLEPGLTLAGVVRDGNGVPLEGVSISVTVQSSSAGTSANHRRTQSGGDGSFRLGAFEGGEVELRAELEGHEPLVRALGRLAAGESVRDLALVLSRGSSISGTVRWPDGSPAEAMFVLVPHRTSLEWSPQEDVSGKSDASGAFAISGLSQDSYRVTARATRTEEVLVESEITGRERPKKQRSQWCAEIDPVRVGTEDLVLTLSTGLVVQGRVVDDLGTTLVDFVVAADRIESTRPRFGPEGALSRSFRDTDGSFRMDGFAPGEWELWGWSRDHAFSEPVRVTLPGDEGIVLVIPRESVVRGRVLDPSGAPVAGAWLEVDSADDGERDIHAFRDDPVVDQQGAFEIDGLGPGKYFVRAHASSFAPSERQTVEIGAGGARTDVVLRLRHGGTVLGELVGSDGRPQAGMTVWVSDHQGFHDTIETDDEGRFRVSHAPPGELFLGASTLEGVQLHENVTLAEGETVRVRLAPPGSLVRLHGRVLAGGEPLSNARIHASRADGERRSSSGATSSSRTGEDGGYELRLPGAGRYWLSIQGDASLSWRANVDAPEVEDFRFDVSIPIGRISGRVTDAMGQALAGVFVQSEPERHEGEAHGSASTLTDDEGRYELLVPAGRHAVEAGGDPGWFSERDLPYAEARVSNLVVGENAHLRGIDLRLDTGGVLEGVVRLPDGIGGGAGRLWVYAQQDAETKPIFCDESGRFRIRLASGSYLVGAGAEEGWACAPVGVAIDSGETRDIVLELLPARLVLVTVRKSGAPVGCELQVLDVRGKRQRVKSGVNGTVWVGPLLPGRYTVRAQRDGIVLERTLDVRPDEQQPKLDLVFE